MLLTVASPADLVGGRARIDVMETLLYYGTTIAILAVFLVLVLGLLNMMKGKSPNLSQKLMRWRVGLQFGAILLIIAYVLFGR